jgi:hypothetical protein
MSLTAQDIALSLFSNSSIKEYTEPPRFIQRKNYSSTTPKRCDPQPLPTPNPSDNQEDDGFTVVKKGVRHNTTTSTSKVHTIEAYSALPMAKPTAPTHIGTGKAFKKNQKRKAKKIQKHV